ncbi:MAG: peptidase U32 family protein [Verrucomicrobiota bacterium]
MKKHVELLAPAGCYPSLQAAIDAGADAVYYGLAQLNMRARARRSFQKEDQQEIIQRCHDADIRGYLTLNTILYDHDLILARRMFEDAARQGVDGVIVSDMAAVQMARECGLEVHISTQLSISNYQSFKFYAQFSDRIVLARELSLPMIKKLSQQIEKENLRGPSGRLMEIETFAHGALCIATSGRCGMSLFTSNASANRGACEQNCRKEYIVTDAETGKQLKVDNNYIMSPNDISTIDFLDEVVAAGINVLKIEGRGRSPEYVYTVINAYRRGLDAVANGSYDKAFVEKLYKELETVYNRGMSSGYYLGREQGWSSAYGSKATRRKVYVGKVGKYYGKIGVAEIRGAATRLRLGDEFVIIGHTSGVVKGTVEEIRLDETAVKEVHGSNAIYSIKVDQKVRPNDQFYLMEPLELENPTPPKDEKMPCQADSCGCQNEQELSAEKLQTHAANSA